MGSVLGLVQAILLIAGAKPLLNFMGVGPVSIHPDLVCLNYVFCNLPEKESRKLGYLHATRHLHHHNACRIPRC